ncbi:hypothetical protein Dsin_012973 [Dipteronia sinensis]|uniref:Reverse transcriptase zinc-binding domain-containing protein n=1 Tax=Dipteronia sinensis TaxID=43782 RepID=A0AAE0AJJ2_9ROSI|nr:hypothetical protein Dsin_012973 [Dipteronia sinensis]
MMVADLIDNVRHRWNLDKLEESFLEADRELILTIPMSLRDWDDCLVWHFDKRGTYNVKSGYKLAVGEKMRDVSSGSSQNGEWWKTLWNLNVPPKVKIFTWKICNEVIPSLSNLFNRKIPLNPYCGRCGDEIESTGHALFWCRQSEQVWEMTLFGERLCLLKGLGCLDVLRWFSTRVRMKDLSLLAMITWGIWTDGTSYRMGKWGK